MKKSSGQARVWITIIFLMCGLGGATASASTSFPESLAVEYAQDPMARIRILPHAQKELYIAHEPLVNIADLEETVIRDLVIKFIDLTPKGATIRLAMFHFGAVEIASALERAAARGVTIRAAISGLKGKYTPDRCEENTSPGCRNIPTKKEVVRTRLRAIDGAYNNSRNKIKYCTVGDNGACIGEIINHNKFFTIDKVCLYGVTQDQTGVCLRPADVPVSSPIYYENTTVQLTYNFVHGNSYNVAMAFFSRLDLYTIYSRYHQDLLSSGDSNLSYNKTYTLATTDTHLKVNFFPKSGSDLILGQLNNITYKAGKECSIRVAMAHWGGHRGELIVDKLASLRNKGCEVELVVSKDVQINTKSGDDYEYNSIARRIASKGLTTYAYPSGFVGNIHAKYMVVHAPYNDSSDSQKIVFFGSHNFTQGAHYRNDEAWIRMSNSGNSMMFDAFTESFLEMKNRIIAAKASPVVPSLFDDEGEGFCK